MKIGVQMYTVRDYLKNPQEIESTLRRIKAMGFDLVQFSGLGPCDADLLAGWTKELNIEVCGTHDPWESLSDPAELKKLIADHRKFGCSHLGLGIRPDIFPNNFEGWTLFIKKVNEICKQVQDEGMTFGYHNHALEFQKWNGVCVLDRLAEECPSLYFVLDLFWVQTGGAAPGAYIDKLKGRVKVIHLKDFRIKENTRQFAEIGEGNMDWSDLIPRCVRNGIPYAVIEQDSDFLIDPFESLALSRKFLVEKGHWKE